MKNPILLFTILFSALLLAQPPKNEVRALWVTTVYNLDWPKASGANNQKNEMIQLLDKIKAANFNTIMLQVRGRGDVIYPSTIEPWGQPLTGVMGNDPGYDPLAFTITEAHKRGIEVHAWWNVVKVFGTGTPGNTNPQHIIKRRPDLCRLYDNEWWLDMGFPDTRTYLVNLAVEMIRGYNIDGIHFDFVRYPDPTFNDSISYANYGFGANKSDWRRSNINNFVYAVYDSVQRIRPKVKVGSAPIGIYKNLSTCVAGWQAFSSVFQDSRRWLLAKKHDYLSPQVYWAINSCPRFDTLTMDWINSAAGRHIYPGIASYRMMPADGDWAASEVLAQIDSTRAYGAQGQTYFRASQFLDNYKNINTLVKAGQYLYPANIVSMPWKDSMRALPPGNLSISTVDSLTFTLRWSRSARAADGDTAAYYNLYRDIVPSINFADIRKVVKFKVIGDTVAAVTFTSKPTANYYFAVTAYDKGYNESAPSNVVAISVTGITDPGPVAEFSLEQNYPNPFNPETNISYTLSRGSYVRLQVIDVLGSVRAVIADGYMDAGTHHAVFNAAAAALPSGVYLYRLEAGGKSLIRKMQLIK